VTVAALLVEADLDFAARCVDWPYIQHPTPYPVTPMTRDLQARGLVLDSSSRSGLSAGGGGRFLSRPNSAFNS